MAIKTFAVGDVLTAADTNTYLANGGLVYVSKKTLSGSSTDITSVFSATYTNYRIVLTDLVPSTNMQLRGQMLSGTTPLTTNTYETQRLYAQSTSVGGTGTNGTPISYGYVGYIDTEANGSGSTAFIEISSPFATRYTWWSSQTAYNWGFIEQNNAVAKNTTSYDGFRLVCSTGTITGTATIYGYRVG